MKYTFELTSVALYMHIKFHEGWYRHSSNIKDSFLSNCNGCNASIIDVKDL
jgi:hypothetical protein